MRGFPFVLFFSVALGCSGALVHTATAQEAPPTAPSADDTDARRAFEAGRDAYGHGAFREALAHFEHAYELSKRPALLFNIARAADADGQALRARTAYEAYLAAFPAAENTDFVLARIAKMREIEALTPPKEAPAAAAVEPATPPVTQVPAAAAPALPTSGETPAAVAAPASLPAVAEPAVLPTVAAATLPDPSQLAAPLTSAPRRDDGASTSVRRRRRALLWTAVGVVVAGGIAGGVLALTRGDERERATGDHYVVIKRGL
jgi:hypothetical protein